VVNNAKQNILDNLSGRCYAELGAQNANQVKTAINDMGTPIYGTVKNQPDVGAGFLTTGELFFTTNNTKANYERDMRNLTGNQEFTMKDQQYYDLKYIHETWHKITGIEDHPGGEAQFNKNLWDACIEGNILYEFYQ